MTMDKTGLRTGILGALLWLCIGSAVADAPLTVDEIVQRTEQVAYYQGHDGRARVAMTITDGQGRTRKRRLTILRRDNEEAGVAGQRYFVHLQYPADVKNSIFMVWKHPDRDDDRWLYLPALDLVRRIAAGDKRTSFLGSNFFYEDISGRSIAEDSHELLETTDDYYVIDNVPRDPQGVAFSHYTMWVHRESFIPVKAEYYDRQGEKYRVYEALAVETIQGYPTVTESRMQDLRSGGETVLKFSRIDYDLDIPEEIFTERYLRQPPRQYLQ